MPVLVVGLNHKGAPLELLERLSFVKAELPKALRAVTDASAVQGAVILSTCNRVEVYADVEGFHAGSTALRRFLAEYHHVPEHVFADRSYGLYEDDAVAHLFAVASGVESMVVGEPQILAQVRRAFADADAEGGVGWLLSALFRRAIRVGRRVRAETGIESSAAGLADAGTAVARRALGGLLGKTVLLVGAGKMSDLAAAHLARDGARVLVANRTASRADKIAARVGGDAVPLDRLVEAIARSDLVLASTGSAQPLVTAEHVEEAMRGREDRTLHLLDLAVPRDIEPGAGDVPGVVLSDLDDLRDVIEPDRDQLREVERARAIVEDEVPRFAAWRRGHAVAPVITALKQRGEQLRAAELRRARRRLAGLTEEQLAAVEALSAGVVAKLLHDPIVALKARAGTPEGDTLRRALEALWKLTDVEGEA